ncbi:MAG: hypothetical protein RL681_696 [Candidatus Parcubacteria bacterium]|jgi:uncharacterized membrane protein YdbT with pleckstrin-like domain
MLELHENERVMKAVRQHWFVFVLEMFFLIILALLPLLEFILPSAARFLGISLSLGSPALFLTATWFLFVWVTFFVVWTNYYLDTWIVTDKRVIDIEQKGLFNRSVSECSLDRVQDVTTEVKGFLPTLLRYGDVTIQTAGEQERFVMRNVPEPYSIKDAIVRAHGSLQTKENGA